MVKVLVVDDERQVARICAHFLQQAGWEADCAHDADEALSRLRDNDRYGIVFLDLKMPRKDGFQMLKEIKSFNRNLQVVMITAHANTEVAVECMKQEACDFVTKPFKRERVLAAVERAFRSRSMEQEVHRLQSEVQRRFQYENLIGRSRVMEELSEWIGRCAECSSPALILGESGTGKDLVARTIHYNSSRRDEPFIAVNCAALPRELIESELFGHRRGAFTGAVSDSVGIFRAANGGTVFLDEIVEMPPVVQAKLLRAVQERRVRPVGSTQEVSVDVRILAATNRDAAEAVEQGELREDLFYRISVISFKVPPLRDRLDDIPLLFDHFLRRFNNRSGRKLEGIESEALEALMHHRWGGNVRELENVIERGAVLCGSPKIGLKDLPEEITREAARPEPSLPPVMTLAQVERDAVRRALQSARGNVSKAARMLGITRKRLYRLARMYALKI